VTPPQVPPPDASADTRLTMHTLVAPFGIGSGGPKRQPGLPGYSGLWTDGPEVQRRQGLSPPTSASLVATRSKSGFTQLVMFSSEDPVSGTWFGSGTPTPLPPK